MAPQTERDFPLGHPSAIDTVVGSREHLDWLRTHDTSRGERDFPLGHPKAADTPGNLNHISWPAGVDPLNTHMEPFTGRSPEDAAGAADYAKEVSAHANESAALPAIDARIANDALAAKRRELSVDTLTMEQTQAVLASLQKAW